MITSCSNLLSSRFCTARRLDAWPRRSPPSRATSTGSTPALPRRRGRGAASSWRRFCSCFRVICELVKNISSKMGGGGGGVLTMFAVSPWYVLRIVWLVSKSENKMLPACLSVELQYSQYYHVCLLLTGNPCTPHPTSRGAEDDVWGLSQGLAGTQGIFCRRGFAKRPNEHEETPMTVLVMPKVGASESDDVVMLGTLL